MTGVTSPNDEATRAWDGPLFERFQSFRDEVVTSLAVHGGHALRLCPPAPGERVLDIGCGFGDSTAAIDELVGADGEAIGVDVSPRFVAAAAAEQPHVRFFVADVQTDDLGGPYDMAFSRFGTMFFANPVVALRNVRAALRPDGRLVMVVWRRKLNNDWMYRAELIVKAHADLPDDSDEPTCGPGPFSMANADTVCDVLTRAGFADVVLRRLDLDMMMTSLDRAIELTMALGPGGEVLRLLGDRADAIRPTIERELREGLAGFARPDGRFAAPSSTWVVSARAA